MRARRHESSRTSPGRDPRRRNRNYGTARRGHGQDNRQIIPQPHGYGDRSFFDVFRQPTSKQDLLRPVWGRVVFDTQVSGITGSAIHLEAQDQGQEIRWSPSLGPDEQRELSALVADGHRVVRSRRWWSVRPTLDSTRTTQIYRTLLHELGHHVDWCRATPELYFRRPLQERARSAHRYAMALRATLEQRGAIPFERIRDDAAMRADSLDPGWFGSRHV